VTRRLWIVGGIVAAMLAGAAVATTATRGALEPTPAGTSIVVAVVSEVGATCTVLLRPVVHTADRAARSIVRSYLTSAEVPAVDFGTLGGGGTAGDAAVAALAETLAQGAEGELLRWLGSHVDVTVLSDYSCGAPPAAGDAYPDTPEITGDDFGREPTLVAGRPPDVVGFVRASTGQICEIQMKVEPDWGSGATDDAGAVAARAFLAQVDFTTVDYSAAVRELADFWPPDHDPGLAEANALAQTLTRQAHSAFDTTEPSWLPIIVDSWTRCDPQPSS
jgi:hypothetical protein